MANEITIRVYEQGQGTVLNGGGSGTVLDRGASFGSPGIGITGLTAGDHTLEVTAEDTAAGKAESSRVSTGTFTIDSAGYSDDFSGTADLAVDDASRGKSWLDLDTTNLAHECILVGDGTAHGTGDWVTIGAYYNDSVSQTSILRIGAGGNTTEGSRGSKGPCIRCTGTRFYYCRIYDTDASGNYVNVALEDDVGFIASGTIPAGVAVGAAHDLRLDAETLADRVRLVFRIDGTIVQFLGNDYADDTSADRITVAGHPGFRANPVGYNVNTIFENWTDTP